MAIFIAKRGQGSFPVGGPGDSMGLKVATGTFEVATAMVAADTYEMCALPAGAVVVMGYVYGDDIDTGTEALDFDIGWKANADEVVDADGFGNLGVISGDAVVDIRPEVSIFYPFGGVLRTAGPKKFTAPTTLQLTCVAASNSGHVGTLTLVALYFMDPNFTV